MDEYITHAEHAEFCARLDAENNRQNRRIEILEGTTKQISELTTSVQKLAMPVENMVKEQGRQGDRLEALENRDGEMWRKIYRIRPDNYHRNCNRIPGKAELAFKVFHIFIHKLT